MTHIHDQPGCRPILCAYEAVSIRETGPYLSETLVDHRTLRVERMGAFKLDPEVSWRALVKHRIDSYLNPRRFDGPNFYSVF